MGTKKHFEGYRPLWCMVPYLRRAEKLSKNFIDNRFLKNFFFKKIMNGLSNLRHLLSTQLQVCVIFTCLIYFNRNKYFFLFHAVLKRHAKPPYLN